MAGTNGSGPVEEAPTSDPVVARIEHVSSGLHGPDLADALVVHLSCAQCGTETDPVLVDVHYPLLALAAHARRDHPGAQPPRLSLPGRDF